MQPFYNGSPHFILVTRRRVFLQKIAVRLLNKTEGNLVKRETKNLVQNKLISKIE